MQLAIPFNNFNCNKFAELQQIYRDIPTGDDVSSFSEASTGASCT